MDKKDINLDNYNSYRLNTENGVNTIDATKIGGTAVDSFTENQLLASQKHDRHEREWYNLGVQSGLEEAAKPDGLKELPADATLPELPEYLPVEEPAKKPKTGERKKGHEKDVPKLPAMARWQSVHDGPKYVNVVKDNKDGTFTIEEADGTAHPVIPRDELTFVGAKAERPDESPELQALKDQVRELAELVKSQNKRLEDLEKERDDFKAENEQLKKDIEKLKNGEAKDRIQITLEDTEESILAEFPIGSLVTATAKGKTHDRWRIADKPKKNKDGEWEIMLADMEGDTPMVKVDDLRKWNKSKAKPTELPAGKTVDGEPPLPIAIDDVEDKAEKPAKVSRWQRIKDLFSGRKAYVWLQTRGTPRRLTVEETEFIERDDRRARGGRSAGALALIGAGIAGAALYELLEHKFGFHMGFGNQIREHAQNLKTGHGKEHMEFFNHAAGHRRTGIELPSHLHRAFDADGHQIIKDSAGNVIVSHADAPSGIANSAGTLSKDAAAALRDQGYTVSYHQLQNVGDTKLYMSEVTR